ncbi:short-chain dehydrogenase [Rhizobium rhizophilum]|uniref:Short-chain dehydrogenase n=1 Tax=Rhizobium rhizophilum TaxID=1850373 RepID=A0ABY2QSF8_9HYPH|nr:short-chain dehydrogenase [Rhizobium rhizophilum]
MFLKAISMKEKERITSGGIPRGLGRDGLVLLSYGFRPFYLGAPLWAIATIAIWICATNGWLEVAEVYGQSAWHAHELLFGFMPAVLVGYLMTTVPNWTGRFPLSGRPLAGLAFIWIAGRISMLMVAETSAFITLLIDWIFLPLFAYFCLREVWVARRIADAKPILCLTSLALINGGFHIVAMNGGDVGAWARAGLSVYILLITATTSKLIPSFTNNWLAQAGRSRLAPTSRIIDRFVLIATFLAAMIWTFEPFGPLTAIMALVAASLHLLRAARWFRPIILRSSMIAAMQVSYGFMAIGLLGIAATAFGMLGPLAAIHLLAIAAVTGMMLAIMMRSIRLHTGRNEKFSWCQWLSVPCLLIAASLRITADFIPGHYAPFIAASGLFWIAAFVFFLGDNAGLLCHVQRQPGRQPSPPTRINMR